jgi:iron complex outermembrane receptor protein
MNKLYRTPLSRSISLALAGSAIAATIVAPAMAADAALEEVVVTAQKRAENLQDVAVSLQVLGSEQLEDLQIKGFDDYILYMPTVSYTSNGPGYGQVYMRGISSGGDGNHSASMPSVGVYLDEQPVTTINQILDVHVYDVARIETLSGPQGTLYGQGSQAGTIRIITNKPVLGEFEAGYDIYGTTIKHGDTGFGLDGMVNIPVSDNMAVRLVAWYKDDPGWIDNVAGELEYDASGIVRNNFDLVESDFNTAQTAGFRGQARIVLGENWAVTPSINYQNSDVKGSWKENELFTGQKHATSVFFPTFNDENWYQASLTVEGDIGDMNLVYAGAYLDRDVDSSYDYSGYAEYLEYVYAGYGYYCLYYDALGECADGSQYVDGDENFNRNSHEIRLQSSPDGGFRWVTGLFYQRQEHYFDLQWTVPDMNPAQSVVENGVVVWQTNQRRVDKDTALFGEIYVDLGSAFTLTLGARYFEYNNSLYGFNGSIGRCTGYYDENGNFVEDRENGTPQYPCFNTGVLDNVVKDNDWAGKVSLEWRVVEDKMVYATYSEGFRAGGANRARVPGLEGYQPDYVYNYELGWKTQWADGALRFNGAVYVVDWDDFQYGFLDFDISNLTIITNAGSARTKGVEFDLDWAPTEGLLLSLAGSYNDSKLQEDFWRSEFDREAGLPYNAPKGTEMPYVPEWQYTALARYDFQAGPIPWFVQAAWSYRDGSWTDLEVDNALRFFMDSYGVLNLATGIEKDNWSLEFYANNITDERGTIDIDDPGYYSPSGIDYKSNFITPTNYGIRWAQRF